LFWEHFEGHKLTVWANKVAGAYNNHSTLNHVILLKVPKNSFPIFIFCSEGPRSRIYGHTATLRLIVQPCDEDKEKDDQFFLILSRSKKPVEYREKPKYSGKTCPGAT
jgi:hypothetical protein